MICSFSLSLAGGMSKTRENGRGKDLRQESVTKHLLNERAVGAIRYGEWPYLVTVLGYETALSTETNEARWR